MPRLAVRVTGVVQGVGFRPAVYRAARALGLAGWVRNEGDGVAIEIDGQDPALRQFIDALPRAAPPPARVDDIRVEDLPAAEPASAPASFRIIDSALAAGPRPTLSADLAVCADCLAEIEDPGARRFGYPFTNCTRCGPRLSIALALPYDRPRTTMQGFAMCPACAAEYHDPADRRFHAQPIACPACGPRARLVGPRGAALAEAAAATLAAAELVRGGGVLALKGLGGYQLLCDATSPAAVRRLRDRKAREEKPFAVMLPSIEMARAACALDPAEEAALRSPEAPILLVRRRPGAAVAIAPEVAPGNPYLGVLLPTTPLHRLLLDRVARPIVCTSGNLSDEPMCTGDADALDRLGSIADAFLAHDRPIARPVDDSVARSGPAGLLLLRRARGFAPLPIPLAAGGPTVLALGAHQKSAITLALGAQAFIGQHLGDLHTLGAVRLLERAAADLVELAQARPDLVACDLHPDYASTRLAERLASEWRVPLIRVQHHHAHVAACAAEHRVQGPVLGIAWDGAGLGEDGLIWGGEALVIDIRGSGSPPAPSAPSAIDIRGSAPNPDGARFTRIAHLRPFPLPGGERAAREPRRAALGVLTEMLGPAAAADIARPWFRPAELGPLTTLLSRPGACARTTSAGRLFDAVAAVTGLRSQAGFEAQAAMAVEFAADRAGPEPPYPFPLVDGPAGSPAIADWGPTLGALLDDRRRGVDPDVIAARFHASLADLIERIAIRAWGSGAQGALRPGAPNVKPRVALTGGCFQNLRLLEGARARLLARGFDVLTPRLVPPNDGGLSLGQAAVARARAGEPS
ncbi:MAG: carbamoyltransferase HypF [Polyangiaceae bacterium]|nr:carbamoyltransferase HypF [Polyangiaceae bacterium]